MRIFSTLLLLGFLFSCSEENSPEPIPPTPEVDPSEIPLSDLDILMEGVPDPSELPDEAKADQIFPKQFDLIEFQSPVKSQGRRGVCSIFSTIALMEHLYIKEGTFSNPDFSEQFLQWSAKMEVGSFKNNGGSNAYNNLKAIRDFGIVDEFSYPYESSPWGVDDDERCTGKERPTICYTNGNPSPDVLSKKRWYLPRSRWVSSRRKNIKAFMFENKTGVVAGGQFFYQSWNHGASTLPTSSDYKAKGYILSPNDEDKRLGDEKRAGHSILLVGWDDELSVPMLDKDGLPVLDQAGEAVVETGFFLFKNSWGTSSFGTENPFGAGYGWISMNYVEDYLSINSADEPQFEPEICDDGVDNNEDQKIDCEDPRCVDSEHCLPNIEICDDGEDNDGDGVQDCDDSDCIEALNCQSTPLEGQSEELIEIPDNNELGILDSIMIDGDGLITGLKVHVEIAHSYRGDLILRLMHPDGSIAILQEREGRGEDDLRRDFELAEFNGKPAEGQWILEVSDRARSDTGSLESWNLQIFAE